MFIYSTSKSIKDIKFSLTNFQYGSVENLSVPYKTLYRNFFKESFLFDHIYKSLLDRFVKVWVFSGSLKFNFTHINLQFSKFVMIQILERTLISTSRLSATSFNALFFTLIQSLIFVISVAGTISLTTLFFI